MGINLISCGSYLPQKTILNNELEQKLGLEIGWIAKRTGIEERHGKCNFCGCH